MAASKSSVSDALLITTQYIDIIRQKNKLVTVIMATSLRPPEYRVDSIKTIFLPKPVLIRKEILFPWHQVVYRYSGYSHESLLFSHIFKKWIDIGHKHMTIFLPKPVLIRKEILDPWHQDVISIKLTRFNDFFVI
ncbi:uncharacterized protein LOC144352207 [Saccoglossus kowalevskii]